MGVIDLLLKNSRIPEEEEACSLLITYWNMSTKCITDVTGRWITSCGKEHERVAENRVNGSGAVSGRPRSGSRCHKNRLDWWAGNRLLTLRSHALVISYYSHHYGMKWLLMYRCAMKKLLYACAPGLNFRPVSSLFSAAHLSNSRCRLFWLSPAECILLTSHQRDFHCHYSKSRIPDLTISFSNIIWNWSDGHPFN